MKETLHMLQLVIICGNIFFSMTLGWNDHDLFAIAWGPAIAAFSYVYDKSQNDIILQVCIGSFFASILFLAIRKIFRKH